MKSTEWRWVAITGVAGVLAGVNLGACTIGEIPIGVDAQAGDDGSGGTSGSSGSGGSNTETGGTGGTDTGGSSTGGTGGDTSSGGSSGSSTAGTGGSNSATGGSSTGGTGAGGSSTLPAGCEAQDVREVGACEPFRGAAWNGASCVVVSGCSCEGADCDNLAPSLEECVAAHAHCFDDAVCSDERRAMRDLLNANKTCTETADCVTLYAGCGVSEDGCTGAVYANQDLSYDEYQQQAERLGTCAAAVDGLSCAGCERASAPPSCIDGLCLGLATCALEASEVWHVINQNSECSSDDDCVVEGVGCEVTQDDCTGAVYLAAGYDKPAFEAARDEYYACKGVSGCGGCLRAISPAKCIAGACQRG
jgi:hypothetical protein